MEFLNIFFSRALLTIYILSEKSLPLVGVGGGGGDRGSALNLQMEANHIFCVVTSYVARHMFHFGVAKHRI
jgi:hypothetical protein